MYSALLTHSVRIEQLKFYLNHEKPSIKRTAINVKHMTFFKALSLRKSVNQTLKKHFIFFFSSKEKRNWKEYFLRGRCHITVLGGEPIFEAKQ